ncbi:MAG: HTH-type transcriptional repressor of NAD biosynthesis genes [Candidatus Latescibacterota bacterium]|jgi:HTH-type transcriptional repressor of NAD biosynthesis genes
MEKTLEQQPANGLKIVLFGPESTGKTTLAKALAAHYKTKWVPEYMRTYLQEKWDATKEICTKEDLLPIASGQMVSENNISKLANDVLFCDTNLLELKVYSEYYFDGYCPSEIESFALKNKYNLYFLTYIDAPWEDDDLRDRPYDRSTLFRMFEKELVKQNFPYKILKGNNNTRLQCAIEAIDSLRLEQNAD